jgi:hypothetical protein
MAVIGGEPDASAQKTTKLSCRNPHCTACVTPLESVEQIKPEFIAAQGYVNDYAQAYCLSVLGRR